jgi:hypothetical protein
MLQECENGRVEGFYAYDNVQVSDYLKRVGESSLAPVSGISRNGEGTNLYLFGRDEQGHDRKVLIATPDGHRALTKTAAVAYLNDEHKWVTWFDRLSDGMDFPGGKRRHGEEFGVDRGGRYFFAVQGSTKTEIGETKDATPTLATAELRGRWIFAGEDRVYLFGSVEQTSKREIICDVFARSDSALSFERRVRISRPESRPSPFSVEDMDVATERVILADGRDPPFQTQWLLFDLKTGILTPLGAARAFGFFLKADTLGSAPKG